MGSLVAKKGANVSKSSTNTKGSVTVSNLTEKFPVVAERAARFGYAVKAEYTLTETQMILGENPSWVRKMVTGYRGKDKKAEAMLKARKNAAGVWQIAIESIAQRLADAAEKRALKQDRFNNPALFTDYRQDSAEKAIKRVARIAAEGLSAEESKLLKALLEKLA